MLTNVIYGFINMTYDKIFQHRACPTNKCSAYPYQKIRYHNTGCKRHEKFIRYLQATGISLYSRSSKDWSPYSGTGAQNRIHRQAGTEADPHVAKIFKTIRSLFKRDCNPGFGQFSPQRPTKWQKAGEHSSRFSLNIVLIDYRPRKLHWLTNF
jgi:hypothetical protein